MRDDEIEALLGKYRPIARTSSLKEPYPARTWPWAVAAAALLALTVGLHATAVASAPPAPVDEARVSMLAEQFGGTADGRALAEWLVRQEQRAEEPEGLPWREMVSPAVPR
jgi:hypothetical protein